MGMANASFRVVMATSSNEPRLVVKRKSFSTVMVPSSSISSINFLRDLLCVLLLDRRLQLKSSEMMRFVSASVMLTSSYSFFEATFASKMRGGQ